MAFSVNRSAGSRNKFGNFQPMAEINVTPLVDVMLVLLIIFMVTAPLLTVGVPVDLPKTEAAVMNDKEDPLTVTVDAKGDLYLQESQIELEALAPRLLAITNANPEARIYVRGDKGISYGNVMEVMGVLSTAGFRKVALISEAPKSDSSAPAPEKGKKGK